MGPAPHSSAERMARAAAAAVILGAFLLALPAFLLPLGLPIEGDAVDYRVPVLRWILRHGTFPNWPWTMVDDYPALGELLMLPFYALHPSLARLVPLLGYLGLGAAGGAIAQLIDQGKSGLDRRTLFLAGAGWTLALRPAALQANALMNDNLAAAFLLGSLVFALRARPALAGALAAGALGTRYSVWGTAAFLPLVVYFTMPRGKKVHSSFVFCAIAGLGALPFMVRNILVNGGHPFFPVDAPEVMRTWGVDQYGRGTDVLSFLLLPYDLLYTNTFVNGFFDYTLGKLIYVQLAAVVGASVCFAVGKRKKEKVVGVPSRTSLILAAFAFVHTLVWFTSSQQLRFLLPALVVGNIAMLVLLVRLADARWLVLPTALGFLSLTSVQGDSIRIVTGRMDSPFVVNAREAADCFTRAGVDEGPVGFLHRDGMLGFFDFDFVYLPGHSYGLPSEEEKKLRWIFESAEPREGFRPWPEQEPCLLRRI